ncbi:helicase associated domain-containing protein [Lentimicrobium sp. L6]|uniref:helicase associated domain-containing protein n=1 Tax=Lentimicrobium sp. L6 TaxID=2735916 RepID=UPI0035302852
MTSIVLIFKGLCFCYVLSENRIEKLKTIGFPFESDFRGKKIINEDEVIEKSKKPQRNTWEQNYLRLLDYKIKYGNCNVPKTFEEKSLSYFVTRQRHNFKTQNLTEEQIKKLELLGFEWEVTRQPNTISWELRFNSLNDFFKKHGHSHYKKTDGDETLYHWVLLQRMDFKKGKLNEEKITRLNTLKFIWDAKSLAFSGRPDEERWSLMYEKLKQFKSENGHCLVPQLYSEDKSFGRWVNDQRNNKKKGRLSEEREKLLQELDFIWDTKKYEWNQKLKLLSEFHNEFGHFEVKQSDKGFGGLYYWLFKIRKEGTTPERRKKLEDIGYEFIEYKPENWFEMFSKLAKHKETTGGFEFEEESEIKKWYQHQKILIKRSELPKNKVDILAAIGVNHQPKTKERKPRKKNSASWYEMLEMLKEYHRIHGDFIVPKKYPINQALSSWLYYQKTLKRTDKLEDEKIKAFEEIGFEFPKPLENQKSWDERFEELLAYKDKHGNCQVPVRFKENQQLATWVRTQRRYYKEETITEDKKSKLENIGFIWRVNN